MSTSLRNNIVRKSYIFLFFVMFFIIEHAWAVCTSCATVRYVNNDTGCAGCTDANNGTEAQTVTTAVDTINRCIALSTAKGDVCEIRGTGNGGTYNEHIGNDVSINAEIKVPINGTSFADPGIILRNYLNETVRIKPTTLASGQHGIVAYDHPTIASQYLIIDGSNNTDPTDRTIRNIIIDGSGDINGDTTSSFNWAGFYVRGPNNHIRLKNTLITDTHGSGDISFFYGPSTACTTQPCSGADGNEIINVRVQRGGNKNPTGVSASAFGHCVYNSTSNNLIEYSEFDGCAGLNLQIYRTTSLGLATANNIVRFNKFTNNASCKSLSNPNCISQNTADGSMVVAGKDNQVYNNIFYNVKRRCILVGYNTPERNLIANNSCCGVTGSVGQGYRLQNDSQTTTFVNNIAFQTAGNAFVKDSGATTTVESPNWLSGDPLFVIPCTDQHLTASSSATLRTGGTDLSTTFTTDHAGNSRTVPWSIGAYEFGALAPPLLLHFLSPPFSGTLVNVIVPPIVVEVVDDASIRQTAETGNGVISKVSGPGAIGGTLTRAIASGLFTFDNITFDTAGSYVVRVVKSGGTAATLVDSGLFTILAASAATSTNYISVPAGGQ